MKKKQLVEIFKDLAAFLITEESLPMLEKPRLWKPIFVLVQGVLRR